MSVRERSRLRPQLLERLGWRYMPLWTIEVFTDPSACADRIAGYLGLEKVVLPGRATASANFFDDDVDPLSFEAYGNVSQEPHRPARAEFGLQTPHGAPENNQDRAARPDEEETVPVTPTNKTAGPAAGRTPDGHQPGEGQATEGALEEGTAEEGAAQQAPGQENPDQGGAASTPAGQAATGTAGILPNKAAEDDPRRWGDGPDDDHDAWLRDQKPPHWG